MPERDALRHEVQLASALSLEALADAPGARPEQSLAAASQLASAAERSLHLLVAEARAAGMTWAQVGEVLGVTRQAAQKRFGGQVPERVAREPLEAPPHLVELALELLDDAVAGRIERIEERASAHLRKVAGDAGLGPAFLAVVPAFGEFLSREEPEVQVVGRVAIVSALERRTLRSVRAEVCLSFEGSLLGLNYLGADSS